MHSCLRPPRMLSLFPVLAFVGAALAAGGCDGKERAELARRLDESGNKVLDLQKSNNELKNQVAALKRDLAKALANPGKITLTDPEIIELVASLRGGEALPADTGAGPDPKVVSKIVLQGAQGLQVCYERALKKNEALQYQAGVKLVLGLGIRAAGTVENVSVTPSIDNGLTDCIKGAAGRWKFPPFQGRSVDIEQQIVLTPKT